MIKIAVNGALGRMGNRILELAKQAGDLQVAGAFDQDPALTVEALKNADVLIDFSSPEGVKLSLDCALKSHKALVVGTTGLDQATEDAIRKAASSIPIVRSSNMSIGVTVVLRLLELAAGKLGKDYKVEMTEAHHAHKKDAPSGTAKMMAEVIAKQRGGQAPPIKSIREREIVGDHTVLFKGAAETIEITHKAASRDVFVLGALQAARFLAAAKPGKIYTMTDVLGI